MDRVLITMPKDLEEFLRALSVVQAYQLGLAEGAQKRTREVPYQVTVRMKEEFKYLEPAIRVIQDNIPEFDYSGWDEKQRGEFDCFIDFDFENAKNIALTVNDNIVFGLNTLVGAGAYPQPVLKALNLEKESVDVKVVVFQWDDQESLNFCNYIDNNYPELGTLLETRDLNKYKLEDLFRYINMFDTVIGKRSSTTFLAYALKKNVIEIFETPEEMVLYKNIEASNYKCVVSKKASAMFMWNVWEDLWQGITQGTRTAAL